MTSLKISLLTPVSAFVIFFSSEQFYSAPRKFPRKVSQSSVFNFMANVGAEKTPRKPLIGTGGPTDVRWQSTINWNRATAIQTRRVLESGGQIMSTESRSQVHSINN